jgi:hypothetical protein
MTVTYNTNVLNSRLQVVANAIDAGSGSGYMQIATDASMVTILATLTLAKPCGTVSSGILTFSNLPVAAAAGFTGSAGAANICASDGTVIVSGLTVGGGSAFDVTISQTSITGGDILSLTSATITGN